MRFLLCCEVLVRGSCCCFFGPGVLLPSFAGCGSGLLCCFLMRPGGMPVGCAAWRRGWWKAPEEQEGWEMRIDERTNWPFFINHQTRKTTWQDPRPAKENAPKQARFIPVQHEQVPVNHQQWQPYNPRQMPQPQRFSPAAMPQPQQYFPYQQESFPTHHQQHYRSQGPTQPQYQVRPGYANASLKNVGNQENMQPPMERSIPIKVLHQSAPHRNQNQADFQQPKYTEMPSRTIPIVRSPQPSASQQQQNFTKRSQSGGETVMQDVPEAKAPESASISKPAQLNTIGAMTKEGTALSGSSETAVESPGAEPSTDDHREVEARKRIAAVLEDLEQKEVEVDSFNGSKTDKEFLRLEHELMDKLLKLDAVTAAGAPGEDNIRAERKAAIKRVQQTLDVLELKVSD